ncbi:MAG: response regulator transcription factor [Rhodocyclaceae bacterium]
MQDRYESAALPGTRVDARGNKFGLPPAMGRRMRIAVLDDDAIHLDLIRRVAESLGHDCLVFDRGRTLLHELRRESIDLLISDWHLPDISGVEIVKWVRTHIDHPLPIILVTDHLDERDVVTGLTSGADDYMAKPLRVMELSARVQALLRRSYPHRHPSVQRHGPYLFDTVSRVASVNGRQVELKNKEFELACCMFANLGRLLTRSYLRQTVWGLDVDIPSRSLDTHISSLRGKLALRPEHGYRLVSVYGQGYRLESLPTPDLTG